MPPRQPADTPAGATMTMFNPKKEEACGLADPSQCPRYESSVARRPFQDQFKY